MSGRRQNGAGHHRRLPSGEPTRIANGFEALARGESKTARGGSKTRPGRLQPCLCRLKACLARTTPCLVGHEVRLVRSDTDLFLSKQALRLSAEAGGGPKEDKCRTDRVLVGSKKARCGGTRERRRPDGSGSGDGESRLVSDEPRSQSAAWRVGWSESRLGLGEARGRRDEGRFGSAADASSRLETWWGSVWSVPLATSSERVRPVSRMLLAS